MILEYHEVFCVSKKRSLVFKDPFFPFMSLPKMFGVIETEKMGVAKPLRKVGVLSHLPSCRWVGV